MPTLKFPQGFLWGAAGSCHQTEGNNTNSDWWVFEHSKKRESDLLKQGKNPADYYSGQACDFYNRYEEDFDLAKQLNHNAIRIGVEWARIEPKEGEFNQDTIEHYKKMLAAAKARNLKIFLTLHHYTLPIWFAEKGGFEKKENIDFFIRYVTEVANSLGEYVDFWITINEPRVYTYFSYISGAFPPNRKSFWQARQVASNIIVGHNRASVILRSITGKPVSMAFQLNDIQPNSFWSRPLISIINYFVNDYFLSRTQKFCDFIGVNYYYHNHIGWFGVRKHSQSDHEQSDLASGIHPEGLEKVLLKLHKKYHKPMYITENGLADAGDAKREKFIKYHLAHAHKAIEQGADVRGYLHWSLLDNFEWLYGFGPRFGLIEIDYENNLKRAVRSSAIVYGEICKNNSLEC